MISLYSHGDTENELQHFKLVSAAKGDSIYHEGDQALYWYEVVCGMVRTSRILADGHRQLTSFVYPGDVFGIDADLYCESAEAIIDVHLKQYHICAVHSDAAFDSHRHGVLERALETARQNMFLFGHRTATNRIAAFLIATANRCGTKSGLELPMTRGDIADHLSLTLHTVSRTISDLARRGLIALDGPQKWRILDLDGLHQAAADPKSGTGCDSYEVDKSSTLIDPFMLAQGDVRQKEC